MGCSGGFLGVGISRYPKAHTSQHPRGTVYLPPCLRCSFDPPQTGSLPWRRSPGDGPPYPNPHSPGLHPPRAAPCAPGRLARGLFPQAPRASSRAQQGTGNQRPRNQEGLPPHSGPVARSLPAQAHLSPAAGRLRPGGGGGGATPDMTRPTAPRTRSWWGTTGPADGPDRKSVV